MSQQLEKQVPMGLCHYSVVYILLILSGLRHVSPCTVVAMVLIHGSIFSQFSSAFVWEKSVSGLIFWKWWVLAVFKSGPLRVFQTKHPKLIVTLANLDHGKWPSTTQRTNNLKDKTNSNNRLLQHRQLSSHPSCAPLPYQHSIQC